MIKLKNRTNKAIIFEKMPQICEWVKLGYNIPSIHEALKDDGVITCGLSNFRAHYYQALKSESEAPQPAVSNKAAVPKSAIEAVTKPSVATRSTAAEIEHSGGPESNESESNEPEKKKAESGFIGAFDLDRQRRIAKLEFEKNRNRHSRR